MFGNNKKENRVQSKVGLFFFAFLKKKNLSGHLKFVNGKWDNEFLAWVNSVVCVWWGGGGGGVLLVIVEFVGCVRNPTHIKINKI